MFITNGWCRKLAKFNFEGLDEYVRTLTRLAEPKKVDGMIKAAVFPGAGIVADEVRRNLEAHDQGNGDLAASMFLAVMQNEKGYIYTQIGFAGYDRNGVPNALKANALESGTSRNGKEYQPKTPFVRPAVKATKDKAEAAMAAELDARIKQLMEG